MWGRLETCGRLEIVLSKLSRTQHRADFKSAAGCHPAPQTKACNRLNNIVAVQAFLPVWILERINNHETSHHHRKSNRQPHRRRAPGRTLTALHRPPPGSRSDLSASLRGPPSAWVESAAARSHHRNHGSQHADHAPLVSDHRQDRSRTSGATRSELQTVWNSVLRFG